MLPKTTNTCVPQLSLGWRGWVPTLDVFVTSVVRVIVIVLGVLNMNINQRVEGES